MKRQIYVFGHSEKTYKVFKTTADFEKFIASDIFDYDCRYRYSQSKPATLVVLSYRGVAYGHFDIRDSEPPTPDDLEEWPPTKRVYMVSKSWSYANGVRLSTIGIKGIQYGLHLSEREFKMILSLAGKRTPHLPPED